MNSDLGLDHPLALEIISLRDALAQQQHATQQASAQVQKYALEALSANNRARQLTIENSSLQSELDILRAPRPAASPSSTEAELTLALRRANSRLEHTESAVEKANTSLLHAYAERDRTAGEIVAAYHLLEEARSQEVELRSHLALHDHEKKSYELALTEYAALVRDLETRASETDEGTSQHTSGAIHPILKVIAPEGIAQIKDLTRELARAQADISTLQAQLDVERRIGEDERMRLAETRVELEKRMADDKSAAALVERYMKFSQYHTDVLQSALTDQSIRHEATRNTLIQRIEHLQHSLATESSQNLQLRDVVDTLVNDLSRESAGRRREVRVRLAMAGREAKIEEALKRWERRIREHPRTQTASDVVTGLLFGRDDLDQVKSIIDTLGGPISFRTVEDGVFGDGPNENSLSGPLARILAADIAVEALTAELERETARRMDLERERARSIISLAQPQEPELHKKPELQPSLTISSSASMSLISHDTTCRVSPSESATTVSLNESSPVVLASAVHTTEIAASLGSPCISELEPDIALEALPSMTSESGIPFPASPPLLPVTQQPADPPSLHKDPAVQKLLAQLPAVLQRYIPFQNAFRDCHLTLSALKSELRQKPRNHLLTAVERLDDYNEDARVEIEIRIADEARTANGLEAMIHLGQADAVEQLGVFVEGSSPDVQKAMETAARKRDELEHDIAAVKLVVHSPESEPGDGVSPGPTPDSEGEPISPGFSSWGWKRPFRQSITIPMQPLGLAFPSPHQTLRRVASGTIGHNRGTSIGGGESKQTLSNPDPFAAMGLRIPMPTRPLSGSNSAAHSPIGLNHGVPSTLTLERPRTTSMYHLGLGRSQSGLDLSKRHTVVTPSSKLAGEDSDDSVE